jgi:hypothetical protein
LGAFAAVVAESSTADRTRASQANTEFDPVALLPEPPSTHPRWIIRLASLHVGLDHLVLLPAASLELTAAESEALLSAARDWLAEEPVGLEPISPELWQLTELEPDTTRFDQLRGASSRQATGRNIDAWLPRGPSARTWRRLANELQMLWHEHPVNLERQTRGLPVVNGLWFEGRILAPRALPFDGIVSQDAALLGLGRAAGARVIRPAGLSEVLTMVEGSTALSNGRWLIDPGCWQAQSGDADPMAWREAWRAFSEWLVEFDTGVRPGRGRALRWLLTGNRQIVELEMSPRGRLCFWRRQALHRWFEDTAQ